MRLKIFFPALLFIVFSSYCQTNFQKKFPLVDRYLDSLMKEWNVPGMALGVVYNAQLIYAKGYGYRDLEKKLIIDSKTLFPIASNTKLFTATIAAMLAGEGKFNLDRPVRNYMPSLHFNTDELNTKVTLRDMLSHRTGLPRYDGIWIGSTFTRKETVAKVAFMKPSLGFREGYIYNNMMFASSGAVMETVTGQTWEQIIREKIFQPLEMNASCFTTEEMMRSNNYSLSYFEPDSTRKLLPESYEAQSEGLGPAGTIKSNIEEMSHWMIALLNAGKYKGRQVIPAEAIRQTYIPNAIADKEGKWDELSNALYGLGRAIQTYKGFKILTHTGSIDGFYSNVTFIPGEQLGIFMIHNGGPGGSLRSFMALPVIDRLLGLNYTPWGERYRKDYLEGKARSKRFLDSVNATQVKNTSPSHPLHAYTGNYNNPIYGNITIELQDNQLVFVFRKIRSRLYHFHYDQFITKEVNNDIPDFRLHFLTNNKGDIDGISSNPFGDPLAEFVKSSK